MASTLLAPLSAEAKAWHGLTPGQSSGPDVVKKFGEPTRKIKQGGGKEMFAYADDEAIQGTHQAEFTINAQNIVEQIAVFPAAPVDKSAIESTYGPECTPRLTGACYVRKVSEDDYSTYFWYRAVGLVVFFKSDGTTVQSFLYVVPNAKDSNSSGNANDNGSATNVSSDKPAPKGRVPPGN